MHKLIVTLRQRCDLELLLVGGFHPLTGFLTEADYEQVLQHTRLSCGQLWPMPITLDVSELLAGEVSLGDTLDLCDTDNSLLARLTITDKWKPDKHREARCIFGTEDVKHPGVNTLFNETGEWYLGGSVTSVKVPVHYDFHALRHTPALLKQHFSKIGAPHRVAFQTRNPMHRAHMELTLRAALACDAHILIHPVVGLTKPRDIDYYTRVRCYQKIMHYYPANKATLSLLPLAMRMGGPREALWHALIRKNYGCTHFIVGRDHAGPGNDAQGRPFYDPYAAQQLALSHQDEIGIQIVPFQEMVYVASRKKYCPINQLTADDQPLSISGTALREALLNEGSLPSWFTFPEIVAELRRSSKPKHQQGLTLFFTGLSGAGKTTLAQALIARLMSDGTQNITLLDGDAVRRTLAGELGFSKADRNLNIRRIGFIAEEVTKVGGIAVCAAIAPYREARAENRRLISKHGGYIEIYLSTSVAVCEERDTKGLYRKVRDGSMKGLTGVDDPYEPPLDAEISIDTSKLTIEQSVDQIVRYLQNEGYLKKEEDISTLKRVNGDVPSVVAYHEGELAV